MKLITVQKILRVPNRHPLPIWRLIMNNIIYDIKEKKFKLVLITEKTNAGFTVYVTEDGTKYGVGNRSDYEFVAARRVVQMLNAYMKK